MNKPNIITQKYKTLFFVQRKYDTDIKINNYIIYKGTLFLYIKLCVILNISYQKPIEYGFYKIYFTLYIPEFYF